MSNDLTVSAAAPVSAIATVTPNRVSGPAPTAVLPIGSAPSYPNPAMHIDPVLNLVVIEFHNAEGKITDSTPTPRQLNAYRMTMGSDDQAPPSQALPER